MNRIILNRLDVTDGKLPVATLDFQRGLNVVTGPEDRGKTYAFQCLDYLFASKTPPKKDVPEAAGYTTAWLYFTLDNNRFAGLRRNLQEPQAAVSPPFDADRDIPNQSEWRRVNVGFGGKGESISSYWMDIFGVEQAKLRSNDKGRASNQSVRHVVHLALVDEGRMSRNETPLYGEKGFSDTLYRDAFAVMLNARRNPPVEVAEPDDAPVDDAKRTALETLLEQLEEAIQKAGGVGGEDDKFTGLSEQLAGHRDVVATLSAELANIFAQRESLQRDLTAARSTALARNELRSRLRLLAAYYGSDLRRLDAISETAHYLEQMDDVVCPTCEQDWATGETETVDLSRVREACRREAEKIRYLSKDLETELGLVGSEASTAQQNADAMEAKLRNLTVEYQSLQNRLSSANEALNSALRSAPDIANRMVLIRQRDWIVEQIGPEPAVPVASPSGTNKTIIDEPPVKDLCTIMADLLESWGWHYTPGKVVVEYDDEAVDFRVGGRLRESFGKAVRGLVVASLSLALMDYCIEKSLPHPGFVVLDSPLTTHGGQDEAGNTDRISLDVQNAFYEQIAKRYEKLQVIVIDNKVPPASLSSQIKHIRFGNGPGERYGFFPASPAQS